MKLIAVISATLSLIACSKEAPVEPHVQTGYDPSKVINVSTDLLTRGTPITSVSQMTDLGIFCAYTGQSDWSSAALPNKMFNTRLVRTGSGVWQYTDTPVEWNAQRADDKYSFFAYAPMAKGVYNYSANPSGNGIVIETADTTAGIPSLLYTVPDMFAASQPDLMVSVPQYNVNPGVSNVTLPMQHALTCVGFQVAGNGEKITNFRISNVKMTGRLLLDGGNIHWDFTGIDNPAITNFPSSINFDPGQQYYTATPTMTTNLMAGNGYLMMIPQQLGPNAMIVISYNNGHVRQYPLNTEVWEPGKKIDYKIRILPESTITFIPNIVTVPKVGVSFAANPILVTCADPDQGWILTSNDPLMQMSLSISGTGASSQISGRGTQIVYFSFSPNPYAFVRTVQVYMNGFTVITFLHQGAV